MSTAVHRRSQGCSGHDVDAATSAGVTPSQSNRRRTSWTISIPCRVGTMNSPGLDFNPHLRMMPSSKSLIIGCVDTDTHVDPMNIFKSEPGEVAVFRNVGGRVNPALLETIALLRVVTKAAGGKIGPGANLVVLHHTDCGINHSYRHAPELLARHLGVSLQELDTLAVTDPYKSVALDVTSRSDHLDVFPPRGCMTVLRARAILLHCRNCSNCTDPGSMKVRSSALGIAPSII